jgi:hypothetical protein
MASLVPTGPSRCRRRGAPPLSTPAAVGALGARQDLDKPTDWALLRAMGRRAAVVCAPRDVWFPRQQYEEMLAEVAGVEVRVRPSCFAPSAVSEPLGGVPAAAPFPVAMT